MESSLEVIKAKYQDVLARKVEEQAASMAMELIGQYERTKKQFDALQKSIDRLEAGEDPKVVVEEYYGSDIKLSTGYADQATCAPLRGLY